MSEDNQTLEGDTSADENKSQTSGEKPEKTGGKGADPKEPDYKKKFAESTKESQRISREKASVQADLERERARMAQLERDKDDLESRFKDERPEDFDAYSLKKKLGNTERELQDIKLGQGLDDFVSDAPEASPYKSALRSLKKAFPDKTYPQLLDENFGSVIEQEKKAKKDSEVQKTKPEKGGQPGEPKPKGDFPEDFNSWPLDKRKAYFRKKGL